jgi:hypothetical protein
MGVTWITGLGLGRWYHPGNPFHVYCRAQNVELTVRTEGGGFALEKELRDAFEARVQLGKAKNAKKAKPIMAPKPKPKRGAPKVTRTGTREQGLFGATRSGKRFRGRA